MERKRLKLQVLSTAVSLKRFHVIHDAGTVAKRSPADFEKTFIQCIVYNYDVMREFGDEGKVKAAGKILTKGKDYVVLVGSRRISFPQCANLRYRTVTLYSSKQVLQSHNGLTW